MTSHETDMKVYGECTHANPDDDNKYWECDEDPVRPHSSCYNQLVKCKNTIEYEAAMEWWEANHAGGEGLNGDHADLCYLNPMGTFCRECSDAAGEWIPHEVHLCDALIRPARMYEDPEPAEYCENEVDYEDERCSEHEDQDDD
ncbi:hypothetical protein FDH86_gp047 [Arthrobacter phage Tank]|uniref:Uncharacterized protein n=1 Tax=Arthrobacter phage Tank TaxID=1772319 RepID=A0A0U4IJ59_9CAUD|nr:hypothetical protein FDH86_gp047 [Arthrobacter phage Tank]ALY10582.1 hypothetical protein TANK_47 [Arthrobacter phage Tank]